MLPFTKNLLVAAMLIGLAGLASAQQSWDPYNTGKATAMVAGISGGATVGDTIRLRLAGDVSEKQTHALIASGFEFKNGFAVITASHAREMLQNYGAAERTLVANGISGEVAWSNPAARILRAYVNGRFDKANDTHVGVTSVQDTAVTVQDILRVTRVGNTRRFTSGTRTTTTTTTTSTDSTFRGGQRAQLSMGAEFSVRESTTATVAIEHARLALPGEPGSRTRTMATVGATEYFPQARANATMGLSSKGRLALAGQKAVANDWLVNVSAYADLTGSNKQSGVYAGLDYSWGAEAPRNPGVVPETPAQQLEARLARMTTQSDGVRGVQGLGKVERVVSRSQTVAVVDDLSQWEEVDIPAAPAPEPPATPEPLPPVDPETPTDPGSVTGTMPIIGVDIGSSGTGAPVSNTITNTSTVPVVLGAITLVNAVDNSQVVPRPALIMVTDSCSGATLPPNGTCQFATVTNNIVFSWDNYWNVVYSSPGASFTANGQPVELSTSYMYAVP